jgi:hypothetical protein
MTIKRLKTLLTLLLLTTFVTSCSKKTNDANETFKYWSGTDAPAALELMNGQYWQSPHFTREYIMYLKFKPTKEWWDEYIEYNSISLDKNKWTIPDDSPTWFKPSESSLRYWRTDDFDQGSRYFCDTTTRICYIYEIQL